LAISGAWTHIAHFPLSSLLVSDLFFAGRDATLGSVSPQLAEAPSREAGQRDDLASWFENGKGGNE